jgi:hypothetical protein
MKIQRCWGVMGLLLVVPVILLGGCAAGGAYQGAGSEGSYLTDVPPSFYGDDPMLSQWYTAPYWNPDASP